MQVHLTLIHVFNHWVISPLPIFYPGNKSTAWPEDAQWWVSSPLKDLKNIHYSFFFPPFGCSIFYQGHPLSAIAWGSLNKAHTSKDTCWDAFWRIFGLPGPQGIKEAMQKQPSSRRLQSNTACTKGGFWETRRLPSWEWLAHNQERRLRSLAFLQVHMCPPVGKSAPAAKSIPLPLCGSPTDTSIDEHLMFQGKVCRDWPSHPWV